MRESYFMQGYRDAKAQRQVAEEEITKKYQTLEDQLKEARVGPVNGTLLELRNKLEEDLENITVCLDHDEEPHKVFPKIIYHLGFAFGAG